MNTLQITRRLLLGLTLTGALSACNPDGGGDAPPAPPTPAPTVSLTAAPASLTLGASATLTWSSTNATACTASGNWTGSRGPSGTEANTPTAAGPASYTLTCTGAGGSGSATATVTVAAPPAPTVSLSAAPSSIIQGAATNLTWSSTNATACTASGNWTGSRGPSGTEANTPTAAGPASYTLTCTGAGGSGSATAAVTVNAPSTVSISAASTTITLGSASTLTWTSASTSTCTASGDWSGTRATSGSEAVTPTTTGLRNYTLTCTGAGGSATGTASVQVNPIPTVSLGANPATIIIGASSTLIWSSTNATSCNATGAWTGSRGTSGSETVTPTATGQSVYGLSCTGAGGTVTQTATVQVNPVPTATLTFNGRAVSGGNTVAGQTDNGGINDAAITITVGNRSFTGTANADGDFSIPVTIPQSETASFVRIRALGGSNQPAVRFLSLLGTFAALQTAAGADAVLTRDEAFRVNVTNISTAEAALASEASDAMVPGVRANHRDARSSGEQLVTTDAELTALLMAVNYDEVIDIAQSIALIVDRGYALPGTISNTLEFAQARDARGQFLADARALSSTIDEDTLRDLLNDREVVQGVTAASLPPVAYVATSAASTEENLIGNGASPAGSRLEFNTDGTGRFSNNEFDTPMNWTLGTGATGVAGTVLVRFASNPSYPYPRTVFDPNDPDTIITITCIRELESVDLLLLSTSAVQQRVSIREVCPVESESSTGEVIRTAMFLQPSQFAALTAADVSGQTFTLTTRNAAPATIDLDNPNYEDDLLTLNIDGTGTTFLGRTVAWTVNSDASVSLTLSNDTRIRYRLLRPLFGNAAVLVLSEYETPAGTYVVVSPSYRNNGTLTFSTATQAGVFYASGVGEITEFTGARSEAEARLLKGFAIELFPTGGFSQVADFLQFNDDGTATRRFSPSNDDPRRRWAIRSNGVLVTQSFIFDRGCVIDTTDPNCTLLTMRESVPLSRLGNRQVRYERQTFFGRGANGGNLVQHVSRFYDQFPNGDWAQPRNSNLHDAERPAIPTRHANPHHPAAARPASTRRGITGVHD